jgi:hypothetical protein
VLHRDHRPRRRLGEGFFFRDKKVRGDKTALTTYDGNTFMKIAVARRTRARESKTLLASYKHGIAIAVMV